MSDVLDRLRADNPVRDGSAPSIDHVWKLLEEDSGMRRPGVRRVRGFVLGLAALAPVAAVMVFALTTRERHSSPAGRSGGVLVHYRTRSVFRPAASSGASFAYEVDVAEVWVSGALRRRVQTSYFYLHDGRPARAPLRHEIATNGKRLESYEAGSLKAPGELVESAAGGQSAPCPEIVACAGEVSLDPPSAVRQLYRTGALTLSAKNKRINGRTVDELTSTGSKSIVRLLVDPRSFLPMRITVQYGPHPWPAYPITTTTISDYQRLPLTPSNRGLLRMRAHPGARRMCAGPGGGGPVWPAPAGGCSSSSEHHRPSTAGSHRTVTVAINSFQDPAGLRRTLRAARVPAMVQLLPPGKDCSAPPRWTPVPSSALPAFDPAKHPHANPPIDIGGGGPHPPTLILRFIPPHATLVIESQPQSVDLAAAWPPALKGEMAFEPRTARGLWIGWMQGHPQPCTVVNSQTAEANATKLLRLPPRAAK